jgi:hypothetical protein
VLAEKEIGKSLKLSKIDIRDQIILETEDMDYSILEDFTEAFLIEVEKFYEEHEAHVTRMFGSFIYLQRINGDLRAVKATPVPIKYCPLMTQLLTEVIQKDCRIGCLDG